MLLRRIAPAALALAGLAACEPEVPHSTNPTSAQYAAFDPTAVPPAIPLPNELALTASLPGAQGELLQSFVAAGGFPGDQGEIPITFDLVEVDIDPNTGAGTRKAPQLDLSSIKICPGAGCNVAVVSLPPSSPTGPFTFELVDQPVAADYVVNGDHGTLTLHHSQVNTPGAIPNTTYKTRAWGAGKYIAAAIRGGGSGVKVNGGASISPQPAMFLLLQDKDLSKPENEGLLPGATRADRLRAGAQLEQLRILYLTAGGFNAISTAFAKTEIASLTTFKTAPAISAHPILDPSANIVPLPSDFLLDPTSATPKVQNLPAFGPLATGIATLDGFSTTALLITQFSAPIVVAQGPAGSAQSTFTNNVFIFDLTNPADPKLVDPATYDELLSSEIRQQPIPNVWVAPLVGLQPATPTKLTSKPLKEATEYAVVITNRIVDVAQRPISRSSLGNILLFDNPVFADGKSQLAGVSDALASGLEKMRQGVHQVVQVALPKLSGAQTTSKAQVALAYTFRTQTITTPALQLAAAPYADANKSKLINVLSITPLTPAAAFTKYGVDPVVVPSTDIDEIVEALVPTSNLLDPATGAFKPEFVAGTQAPPTEILKVLVAVPKAASLTACPANGAFNCAPLVVFHHGLTGGRAQMLLGANALTKRGFVVAAIDAPKHGDRAFCKADSECASGTCKPIGPPGTQGDTTPPGQCVDASNNPTALKKNPVLCAVTPTCASGATDGVAVASGNYLISGNLFRFRDTLRQDILDNSNLILAISRPPPPTLPATTNPNPLSAELLGNSRNLVLDGRVFWEGQSLGAILGTINVAANPRISEAVLNVGGGTFVDIAVKSPAFSPALLAILAGFQPPILPGTPEFLQFLQVAKWVIDPAEPINFGGRLLGDAAHPTLPNLLAGNVPQTAKSVLGQMATCDAVVPNPFNALLYSVIGLGPLSLTTATLTVFRDTNQASATAVCPVVGVGTPGTVDHGFLLNYGLKFPTDTAAAQISADAQSQAADFLVNPAINLPPPLDVKP